MQGLQKGIGNGGRLVVAVLLLAALAGAGNADGPWADGSAAGPIVLIGPPEGAIFHSTDSVKFAFAYNAAERAGTGTVRCQLRLEQPQKIYNSQFYDVPPGTRMVVDAPPMPVGIYVWTIQCPNAHSKPRILMMVDAQTTPASPEIEAVSHTQFNRIHWIEGWPSEWFMSRNVLFDSSPAMAEWFNNTPMRKVYSWGDLAAQFVVPAPANGEWGWPLLGGTILLLAGICARAKKEFEKKENGPKGS